MRAIFSVVGLLLVVAIVGLLAKKQLTSVPAPAVTGAPPAGVVDPAGTPRQQVQQFQQAVQESMQSPRTMPDDK
jgi:hypothetical protein